MSVTLGIDLGGTAAKIGLVDQQGTLLSRVNWPVPQGATFDDVADALASRCVALERDAGRRAYAIGLATPGYADPATGTLIDGGGNIAYLMNRSLRDTLAQKLGRTVRMENDGVAAALAEARFGAGRRFGRFMLLTLGTGVGGAVVLDGVAQTGPHGIPAELGAIVLDASAEADAGTLEALACAGGFLRAYQAARGDAAVTTGAEVAGRTDDPAADRAVDTVAGHIAHACGTLVNALALDACLLGGGLSDASPHLPARVARHLPRFAWPLLARSVMVTHADLGNAAGLIGAAWCAAQADAASIVGLKSRA